VSRGLGWVEREVLAVFEGAGELLSAREVASRVFDHPTLQVLTARALVHLGMRPTKITASAKNLAAQAG